MKPYLWLCLLSVGGAVLWADQLKPAEKPAAPAPAAALAAPAVALPLEEVSTQAEATSDQMHDLAAELANDPTITNLEKEWPVFQREVNARLQETAKLIHPTPSLDTLRHQERSLHKISETLDDWNRDLTKRGEQLDKERTNVEHLGQVWNLTLAEAQLQQVPPQVLDNIQTSLHLVSQGRTTIEIERVKLLSLQNRIAEMDRRSDAALDSVKLARRQLLGRLLKKDSPPLWNTPAALGKEPWRAEARASFGAQGDEMEAYARREGGRFLFHLVWLAVLTAVLYRVRRNVTALAVEEPQAAATIRIFDSPVGMAVVLSVVTAHWIYPQAPRLWWAALGAVALVPATGMLRDLVGSERRMLLHALVGFYLADQVRLVTAALPLVSRSLLAAELLAAVVLLAVRRERWLKRSLPFRMVPLFLALAFGATFLGYVSLGTYLGDAIFGSAYAAVLLSALARILEVLVWVALYKRPLALLRAVREYRREFVRRSRWFLQRVAWVLWALITLERLALRESALHAGAEVLNASLRIGALSLSLGHLIAFGGTVWAAFKISRFARFLLDEDVYPNLALPEGLPYAISMMLHYLILVAGFLAAAAALGFDMTKFTILAGAFGVGVGFGLQTILNNFFSGLILLFERPVKVGDQIKVEDAEGTVLAIGIRATIIRTATGSRVIIPNGTLIASRVTNFTTAARARPLPQELH